MSLVEGRKQQVRSGGGEGEGEGDVCLAAGHESRPRQRSRRG